MRVIIESPFAGDVEKNLAYLRACMRDSLLRGEAPYASHALYTQPGVLDDTVPREREMGILAGFDWRSVATKTIVYTDLGISEGMRLGIEAAEKMRGQIEYRSLGEWQAPPIDRVTELQAQMSALVSSSLARQVREFHNAFGVENRTTPCVPPDEVVRRRLRLVAEEFFELLSALLDEDGDGGIMSAECAVDEAIARMPVKADLPGAVDAIADLNYVLEGTVAEFGVHMKPIQDAVHVSNMAKVGSKVDASWKIQKPAGWQPPDVAGLLKAQGWQP